MGLEDGMMKSAIATLFLVGAAMGSAPALAQGSAGWSSGGGFRASPTPMGRVVPGHRSRGGGAVGYGAARSIDGSYGQWRTPRRHRHHGDYGRPGRGGWGGFWGYGYYPLDRDDSPYGPYYAGEVPADFYGFYGSGGDVLQHNNRPVYVYDRAYPYDWYGGNAVNVTFPSSGEDLGVQTMGCEVQSIPDRSTGRSVPVRVCRGR
jgi:hypothetical protein